MSAALDISLSNRLPEIHRIAELVEDFGEAHGLPARAVFNLNLALDEVLTNVIEYGYPDAGDHEIIIRLGLADGMVRAEVIDDGAAHDPTLREDPDITLSLDQRPIGGLGIFFAKRMMDRIEYVRDGNLNRLTLWRRIDRGSEQDF